MQQEQHIYQHSHTSSSQQIHRSVSRLDEDARWFSKAISIGSIAANELAVLAMVEATEGFSGFKVRCLAVGADCSG